MIVNSQHGEAVPDESVHQLRCGARRHLAREVPFGCYHHPSDRPGLESITEVAHRGIQDCLDPGPGGVE